MDVRITDEADTCGTSLLGYLDISYAELVEKLGEPTSDGDECKVDAEWGLAFEDGTVATIYNYKDGPNSGGGCVEDIRDWHIGGRNKCAVKLVHELIYGPDMLPGGNHRMITSGE